MKHLGRQSNCYTQHSHVTQRRSLLSRGAGGIAGGSGTLVDGIPRAGSPVGNTGECRASMDAAADNIREIPLASGPFLNVVGFWSLV